jgi:hypothetical protein
MQFTGLGEEETPITGATPKGIFLVSSASAKIASELSSKVREIWPCHDLIPGQV